MLRRILFSIILVLGLIPLMGQEIMFETYDHGTDIWILLPYDLFHFGNNEDVAQYQVSLQIKNSRGSQVATDETQIMIPNREWLHGTAIPIRRSYDLSTGTHNLNLSLRNRKLGDKQNFNKSFNVGSQATELGQAYVIATRDDFSYIPENLELHNLQSLKLVHSFAIGASRLILELDQVKQLYDDPQSPVEIDLTSLAEGDSISSLRLSLDEMNIRYQIEPLLYRPWFSFNHRYSLKDQMEQIRYIANQNEWRVLRKVAANKHSDAIESFWQAKDPSPGTLRNEYREYFYQRVLYADEHFTIHSRLKGWKSDRGRIYIKFGEPDQIINDAFPIGRAPSITWHYFRLNRSFIFADERGFGQYRLRNKDEEYKDF